MRDTAQWHRFARLRDRVESDAEALGNVRGVLAPVERELWEEADEAASTGARGPKDRFTAGASRRVDAVLTTLGV